MTIKNKKLLDIGRGISGNPLREISKLQRNVDRMFEDILAPVADLLAVDRQLDFIPSSEVEESNDHYTLRLDLPGVMKDDVKIEMRDDQLLISGEKKEEHEKKEGNTVFTEREYGSFQRVFTLPVNASADKIEAHYQDGVLRVVVPKTAAAKPKTIEIKEGKGAGILGKVLGREKKGEADKAA